MSISSNKRKKGQIQESIDSLIESFLEQGKGIEFNTQDIAFGVFNLNGTSDGERERIASTVTQQSLDNLVKEGRIFVNSIKRPDGEDVNYYSIA
jgi:hypothetical protein